MKAIISIAILSLYIAFNIGMTIHVHACEMKREVAAMNSCHQEESSLCFEEINESSCCSNESKNKDCCFNDDVHFQLEQEQIISKKLILIPFIELTSTESSDLSISYKENDNEVDAISHPPPIKEIKPILFCSLTLFG
jgi:hypothetical protein